MPRSEVVSPGARFIVLASICIVVAALYFMQDVLIPLALAVLVSFLLTPLVNRLERWGIHRVPAVVLVVIVGLALVAVLGWVVWLQVNNLATQLPQYRDSITEKVRDLLPRGETSISQAARTIEEVQKAVSAPATTQAAAPTTQETQLGLERGPSVPANPLDPRAASEQATETELPGLDPSKPIFTAPVPIEDPMDELLGYLGLIGAPLATAGIVIVFVVFMLLQREDLRDRLIRLMGQRQLNVTTTALDDAATRISRYLVAQAIINGTYGVAIGLGLWIIGLTVGGQTFPNFVLWGLLCALLRFIPYIGPWIAAAFPITVSFAMFDGYHVFVATAAMFIVIELLSNNVMEPLMYGASTGLSAVAVLVAAVFWTFLWGPIGLLLATPLTVCIVVLGKYVPPLRFLDIMLGDEPVFSPPERMYQRLLALDEEEAHELAEEFMEEMPLEQVYDQVLMPTLGMAEQDRHRGRLDERRQAFIRRVMKEIVEDLADEQRTQDESATDEKPTKPPKPQAGETGNGQSSVTPPRSPRARLPETCSVNVVCLPAHDEADEIIALMLGNLLDRLGFCAVPMSVKSLASEMVAAVDKHQAQIVCVSAMPPAAVSHARYLCKRVHQRHPDIVMVVGLWTYRGDLKRARARTTCVGADEVATTLSDALDEIHQRTQTLLATRPTAST